MSHLRIFGISVGDATTTGELGDPTADTQYAVCVWDDVGGAPPKHPPERVDLPKPGQRKRERDP